MKMLVPATWINNEDDDNGMRVPVIKEEEDVEADALL